MKDDKFYSIGQLRGAWGAGRYSAEKEREDSIENQIGSLEWFESESKATLVQLLSQLGACSSDTLNEMKDYNSTADAILNLHDQFPEKNTNIDLVLQILWKLNEFASNVKIENKKEI